MFRLQRRITSAVAVMGLLLASCGGLSDAERAWCRSNGADVRTAAKALGFFDDLSEWSNTIGGRVTEEGHVRLYAGVQGGEDWTIPEDRYNRACKAAYESR